MARASFGSSSIEPAERIARLACVAASTMPREAKDNLRLEAMAEMIRRMRFGGDEGVGGNAEEIEWSVNCY